MQPKNAMRSGRVARYFPAALVATVVAFGLYLDHVTFEETAMKDHTPAKGDEATRALHGPRSEVTWEGGSGRQPYANQGRQEAAEPAGTEVAEGNRGDRSGRNIDQLDEARRKP